MIEYRKKKKFNFADFMQAYTIYILAGTAIFFIALGIIYLLISSEEEESLPSGVSLEEQTGISLSRVDIRTLNPLLSQDEDTYTISSLVYDSLFEYDEYMNFENNLVESYTTNDKAGTVTIQLKEGIKFHDGTSFNGYDVEFTFDVIKEIGSSSVYYDKIAKIDEINVASSLKLIITFKNPNDASLENLIFPIISGSSHGNVYTVSNATDFNPIGTGQYELTSYDIYKELVLSPYEAYHGRVAKEPLYFKLLTDKENTVSFITMHSINYYYTDDEAVHTIADDRDLLHTPITSNDVEYIGFNFQNPVLAHKEFRQAICSMINLDYIIDRAYSGFGIKSNTLYYPNYLNSNREIAYGYNKEKYNELLKALGYQDYSTDGFIQTEAEEKITLKILVNSSNKIRVDAAEIISEQLKTAGIDSYVHATTNAEYLRQIAAKDYDLYLGGYTFDASYNLSNFYGASNNIGYNNSEVRTAVLNLEKANTAENYAKIYSDLEEILIDDIPYYPICYKTDSMVTSKYFTYDSLPTWFDNYKNIDTWNWSKPISESE